KISPPCSEIIAHFITLKKYNYIYIFKLVETPLGERVNKFLFFFNYTEVNYTFKDFSSNSTSLHQKT
ncbi:hypothetical protein, partial [Lactobacillus crispatus]|uniref:hypothetical protein n=1 Tax=Lactobacillus crispatus TaxID=47770 RepID=UPI001CC3BAE4